MYKYSNNLILPSESAWSNLSDLGLNSQIDNKALTTQVSFVNKPHVSLPVDLAWNHNLKFRSETFIHFESKTTIRNLSQSAF